MTTLHRELATATDLARRAGQAVLDFYGSTDSVAKAGGSPVTEADYAANRIIVEGLTSAFAGDGILSEESADSPDRLERSRVWIVDPLDGTKEFLAQNGEFSVMIGLAIQGRPVLGVVYLPALDVMYGAIAGEGAWVERSGTREVLRRDGLKGSAPRLVGSRSHPDPLIEEIVAALGISDVVPCGSVGVKCSRIAEDQRDLYVHPVPYLKEWDTCAPEVIAREAGATVTDCRGEPLRYNKVEPVQPHGILVRAPGCDGEVEQTVRRVYESALRSV
ncbi:MAG: 3'(2'),5'-bisphosphate nucleotidase CysQ [Gemmatimonas sp.]|nr:3'(2'),5'-bisphosphate nucleotidase CysQ [Gemmatimonas sp.]